MVFMRFSYGLLIVFVLFYYDIHEVFLRNRVLVEIFVFVLDAWKQGQIRGFRVCLRGCLTFITESFCMCQTTTNHRNTLRGYDSMFCCLFIDICQGHQKYWEEPCIWNMIQRLR